MISLNSVAVFRLMGVIVLWLFLPLIASSFCLFRRHRRISEVKRIFSVLGINEVYKHVYEDVYPGWHFLWAVSYASVVSCIGLAVLFLSAELGLDEFPSVQIGSTSFPANGSRLVFGMAFLGAYLWGLQHLFRRYSLNDLYPGVYYGLSVRMILAAIIALVIFNGYEALAGSNGSGGITANIWPALALLIGMFPRRGLVWLTERLPFFSPQADPSVRRAALEMIEGVSIHDRIRLEELGIDTCYELAAADFVPLTLKTPYGARELVDWILQAKLCVYFGEAVRDLRQHGIRTVIDLKKLDEAEINGLAQETSATRTALERVQKSVKDDPEIDRLRKAALVLSKFWEDEDDFQSPPRKQAGDDKPKEEGSEDGTAIR